jgi:hypothetical protein
MGSDAPIHDIPNVFEVEKDMLKVLLKWLSMTLAESCRFEDGSEQLVIGRSWSGCALE